MDAHPAIQILYLWQRRTLHIANLVRPVELSQAAASLTVSLGGALRYRTPEMSNYESCTSLLLAPGSQVTVDVGDALIGTCYLDALGQDHELLAVHMAPQPGGVHRHIPRESGFREFFQRLHQAPLPSDEAFVQLEQLINPDGVPYPSTDPRVDTVVSLIRESVTENLSVDVLAAAVNLSVPRLVQLFREQVGVPIRRYRQWHRLYVTAHGVARGLSLTDAAIGAGFTDSAHFSHTFRTILGLRPSDIFSLPGEIRLIVANEP